MRSVYFLLTIFLTLFFACSKEKEGDGKKQNKTSGQKALKLKSGYFFTHDSGELSRFLPGLREQQDLGPHMQHFYEERGYDLAWFSNRKLIDHASKLIEKLQAAAEEGLNPERYEVSKLSSLMAKVEKGGNADDEAFQQIIKDLDLMLTTEAIRYAADVGSGVTRLKKKELRWYVEENPIHYEKLVNKAMSQEGDNPFDVLVPPRKEYAQLKNMLKQYREFAQKGGWPKLTGFEKLQLGDTSDHVVPLRERLSLTSDITMPASTFFNPKIFDKSVEQAVKEFQTRHGLEPDGVVGGNTLDAINVPVSERITQVIVNMERWRLVPRNFSDNYVMVNVPEFRLRVFEDEEVVLGMRVIVGKEFNSTPIFSDSIRYVVFSPYWNVPKSILREEILPAVSRNPYYFSSQNMEVLRGYGNDMVRVSPWEVPWYNIDNSGFTYWVRQRPGPDNPLGLVKFLFPNNHNVYLHDTPMDHLFSKAQRGFSHGCIRVEKPFELTKYLLRHKPEWTEDRIQQAMHAGTEKYVTIDKVPVYILYFTTWMDEDGKVQIRDDFYGLDKQQAREMELNV